MMCRHSWLGLALARSMYWVNCSSGFATICPCSRGCRSAGGCNAKSKKPISSRKRFSKRTAAFPRFRGGSEGELAYWLRQILAARLAMLVRHYFGTQQRDVNLERELCEALDQSSEQLGQAFVASGTSPSQGAVRREEAVRLADALGELPPDYRQVIALRHLESMTFPELAKRMGRSVDAVEKLWARALVQLRRLVPKDESTRS